MSNNPSPNPQPPIPDAPEPSAPGIVPGHPEQTLPEVAPKGYWDLVWGQFKKNKIALVSFATIFLLMLVAAWSPLLANGKPLIWTRDGKTTYPLLQYLVAPTSTLSIDYFFNYLLFVSLTLPVTLGLAYFLSRSEARRKTRQRLYLQFGLAGAVLAVIPFLGFSDRTLLRKWRMDSIDYPRLAQELDRSKGDYALFPPVGEDPITPTRDYLKKPSAQHPLGTDREGRDVLARMLHGARVSLSVGFVAETIAVLLGVFFGALAGYYRGWVDIAISRFIEIVICFPSFFLILTIVAFIEPEKRSIFHIMIVIGATGWTGIARLVRGEFLKLADQDFVQSARALGCSNSRLMFRHILPNAMGPVLVSAAFGVAGAILTESGLSYLGFGAPPPTPTWGEMISQGKEHLDEAWWLIVYPGLSIFFTVTVYNLAGDGLRDAMDPKMRK
ncbi:MAG TPA: ABC transporter permease [Planctomycetota bacterium]|nr:ABC transporter permease [Planctomycetota bacterium]